MLFAMPAVAVRLAYPDFVHIVWTPRLVALSVGVAPLVAACRSATSREDDAPG